ncbi:MAG: hypothetical protein C0412_13950 [Flavobacterium sp.]|nr:hypothetical protein [Flavobacterium sp.]
MVQAQDYATINKMQNSSIETAKALTNELVNLTDKKFEFYKEKQTSEYYLLVYIPVGLTAEQKEESRVNSYENGIVFRLSKQSDGGYKIYEFFAAAEIMFPIIKKAFYPNATYADFTNTFNYTAFIDKAKNYNFHFYKGDKYRFLSSR